MGGHRGENEDPNSWDQHGWGPLSHGRSTRVVWTEEPVAHGVVGHVCGWTWLIVTSDGRGRERAKG